MSSVANEGKTQQEINEIVETRAERKARIANVFGRGLVATKLDVKLPDGTYGEWVRNDKSEISRFQAMGFRRGKESELGQVSMHNAGTDDIIVGDVTLMIAPMEVKEIIDELRDENFKKRHGDYSKVEMGSTVEEREFKTNSPLPVIDESSNARANQSQIREALDLRTGS